ncbi:MAG TPA: complex I subunit 1 family protein [Polyangiaceae bacterium]|nr:complex I subunit 1 family protein [Polyangiaceae bacterium]
MSLTLIALFTLKAFAVVMFAMNLGVILTWVDRRQGSMIQDRVGPNRAAIPVPAKILQVALVIPALLAVAGIAYLLLGTEVEDVARTSRALTFSQLAILATWLTALVIAGRVRVRGPKNSFDVFLRSLGDPRRIFYGGIALHVLVLAAFVALGSTELAPSLYKVGYGSGSALLGFAILFGAGYAAYMLRNEDVVRIRLAGLLHPAADGLKTAFKEDFIPPNADRLLHSLAPFLSFFPVLVVLAVVPFGDTLCFELDQAGNLQIDKLLGQVPRDGVCADGAVDLQVVDLNVGVLYFFALAGTGIVGAALAGWASDNKFSLLGGLRAASQMVSYEVTLGLTVIGALMIYGTVRVDEMVRWQAEHAWGIFVQPFAFFLFFAAAVAESKRIPFDLPEGESEIVAGCYTEYSGMKFSMLFFAEYIAVATSSVLMVALFLGGWHLPFVNRGGIEIAIGDTIFFEQALSHGLVVAIGVLGFIFKVLAVCFVQLTIRWTLPRFRYDQLMRLGWRKLLPASLANILTTGLVVLLIQSGGAAVQRGLNVAADLSMLLIALLGLGLGIWFVLFLLKPVHKRRLLVSSSAKYAEKRGGTRWARMEA